MIGHKAKEEKKRGGWGPCFGRSWLAWRWDETGRGREEEFWRESNLG